MRWFVIFFNDILHGGRQGVGGGGGGCEGGWPLTKLGPSFLGFLNGHRKQVHPLLWVGGF